MSDVFSRSLILAVAGTCAFAAAIALSRRFPRRGLACSRVLKIGPSPFNQFIDSGTNVALAAALAESLHASADFHDKWAFFRENGVLKDRVSVVTDFDHTLTAPISDECHVRKNRHAPQNKNKDKLLSSSGRFRNISAPTRSVSKAHVHIA